MREALKNWGFPVAERTYLASLAQKQSIRLIIERSGWQNSQDAPYIKGLIMLCSKTSTTILLLSMTALIIYLAQQNPEWYEALAVPAIFLLGNAMN